MGEENKEGTDTVGVPAMEKNDDDSDESMKDSASPAKQPMDEDPISEDKKDHGAEKEGDETVDNQLSLEQQEAEIRNNPVVGDQLKLSLADNNCITTILNMFFKFPWNNFLHNVVFDIVQQILNGPMHDGFNKFLAIDLFGQGHLTDLICQGHASCEKYEAEHKMRLGYMGHLTLISEEVVKFTAVYTPESISPVIAEAVAKHQWIQYVTHTLVKTRDQYNLILGGRRPDGTDVVTNPDAIILGNGGDIDPGDDDDGDLGDSGQRGGRLDDDDDDDDFDRNDNSMRSKPSEDHFVRYLSEQMSGSGHVGLGSSDEDDDEEEWEDGRRYRSSYHPNAGVPGKSDDEEHDDREDEPSPRKEYLNDDDSDDDDLGLVRSPSYHDMN
jgi:SIT4-associating protein SAP185/190